jgi:hypothetical protein
MHLRSLASLLLASALTATAFAAGTVSEKIAQTYPFNADGVVSLAGVNGSVEIVGWDKNEVSLEAEKIASDAEGLARMQIVIEHSPAHLTVKTEHERKWKLFGGHRAEVRYKLRVPATATLKKIDVVNASITVRGVTGYVDLDTVNGAIDAEGLASGGRFDTVNGSIRATFVRVSAQDRIVLDTVNGSCDLALPADAAFELKADTVNGRISCDFPLTLTKQGRTDLAGSAHGGGASVVLDSVNGALSVRAAK